MVIAIVSDLHGKLAILNKLKAEVFPSVDEIWWIGDLFYNYKKDEASVTEAKDVLTALLEYTDKPSLYIAGNTDSMHAYQTFESKLDRDDFHLKTMGEDIFVLTHGHIYESREALLALAAENKAQVVISGHTHIAELAIENDVIFINPGSPSVPRDDEATPTYILFYPEEHKVQIKHLPSGDVLDELYYCPKE
jgi:putative phosphoesterase